ncbi:MAG: preprotein translocase subunit SecE [Acutalibacteraceae bacterium]|jgi:preprotein translocase subunit SecE
MADEVKKTAKDTSKKGPGAGKKMGKFFRDTKGEFKKIIWPTFPAVVRNTGVTLAMCVVLGVVIAVVDFGLSALINLMV